MGVFSEVNWLVLSVCGVNLHTYQISHALGSSML